MTIVYFKYFDPLVGKLPVRYDWMFAELAARARRLLVNRTLDDIHQAAKILTNIEKARGYKNPIWDEIMQPSVTTIMDGREVELHVASNDIEALFKNVCNVSLSDYPEFSNGQWHELFAVLALSYMERVLGSAHVQEHWQPFVESKWLPGRMQPQLFPRLTDEDLDAIARDSLTASHQAVSYAEMLYEQATMLRRMRAKESGAAVTKRHQTSSGPLKALVLDLYEDKYKSRSNREAARRIFDDLKKQGRVVHDETTGKVLLDAKNSLQTDDPEKRFEIWIGKHKGSK